MSYEPFQAQNTACEIETIDFMIYRIIEMNGKNTLAFVANPNH